ncbi:MAG: hypothetical protein WKG01_21150 [Kofleriaceae bacterium]
MRAVSTILCLALFTPTLADANEVIVIDEVLPPPVRAKVKNFVPTKAPPYSDRAILTNAWTRAWLMLDLDETGTVTRAKFLKRPGADLDDIAVAEVFKLDFDPARDDHGRPVKTVIIWGIDWPAADWLVRVSGTRSAMPPYVDLKFPLRKIRVDELTVPCRGTGPSITLTYRDCAKPDLANAKLEPWIGRPR